VKRENVNIIKNIGLKMSNRITKKKCQKCGKFRKQLYFVAKEGIYKSGHCHHTGRTIK